MSDSFVTSWTAALQAPLSIAFPRQELWSGLPFPSLGDLSCPGIKPKSPALYIGRFFTESDTQTKQLNYLLSSLLLLYSYSFPFSTSISNNCISSSFPLFAYFQLLVFTAIEIWFSFIPLTLNGTQKFISYLLLANLKVYFQSGKQNIVFMIIFFLVPPLASRKLCYFGYPSVSLINFHEFLLKFPPSTILWILKLTYKFALFLDNFSSTPWSHFIPYMSMPTKAVYRLNNFPELQTHTSPCLIWISFEYSTNTLNLTYLKLKSMIKSLLPPSFLPSFTSLLLCLLCLFLLVVLLLIQPLRLEIIKSGLIFTFSTPFPTN